jgi:hypothetical protein
VVDRLAVAVVADADDDEAPAAIGTFDMDALLLFNGLSKTSDGLMRI